jgi:hypothetical protein
VQLKRVGRELVGPCPACGGHDRFSANVTQQLWNCRGCAKGGDVIDLVQHLDGVGFIAAKKTLIGEQPRRAMVKPAPKVNSDADDYERRQRGKAAWLWQRCQPIVGSIAETYLRKRGYHGPLPLTLGFLPPWREHHPAMIAAFALVDEPEPGTLGQPHDVDAVHLTLLKPDGSGKAEVAKAKLFVCRPLGRPIVLAPIGDMLSLAITEGIEDGLSVRAGLDMGVWAAGSSGRMAALADSVPSYIETVTIWQHNDDAGRAGASKLADLLHRRGVEVFIARPKHERPRCE